MSTIFSIFLNHKRLLRFLGIPTSLGILLFLVRFFFLSKNGSVPPPGVLSPNNSVHFSGIKNFSIQELENEVDSIKRMGSISKERKPIPLRFPNRDSMYQNQLRSLRSQDRDYSIESGGLLEHENSKPNPERNNRSPKVEFYDPSIEEVRKYQIPSLSEGEMVKKSEFNSYTKPEQSSHPIEKLGVMGHPFIARVVENQIFTDGTLVQLRFIEEQDWPETRIPKNTLLKARIEYEGNRVLFKINSIRMGGHEWEGNWVSLGDDQKLGIPMKDFDGNSRKSKNYLSETKNELVQEIGQQISNTIPLGSSLLNRSIRKVNNDEKKPDFKIHDEYEIRFISN